MKYNIWAFYTSNKYIVSTKIYIKRTRTATRAVLVLFEGLRLVFTAGYYYLQHKTAILFVTQYRINK